MYYYKYFLLYFTLTSSLVKLAIGARIHRNSRNHQVPDMKVIESQFKPEIARKDLMAIIKKSQFFQDIFSEQPDPMIIQFGHVCENPSEWEQRFEQRNFNKNHYQGKMKWGNKNGDYGEHYWDLAHAG